MLLEMKNVTAGYGNPGPMRALFEVTSAANIDLKGFTEDFYKKVCGASLAPVLDTLLLAKEVGVWLEVTNLVIPTLNDDPKTFRQMARWLVENLGRDLPLHLSRFVPHHRLQGLPPTPEATLTELAAVAEGEGLRHVYLGNVAGSARQDTLCPSCRRVLVQRAGYAVGANLLASTHGRCPSCGFPVAGVWS